MHKMAEVTPFATPGAQPGTSRERAQRKACGYLGPGLGLGVRELEF